MSTQITRSGSKRYEYSYPDTRIRMRTDDPVVAAALAEARKLGLSNAAYIRWLMAVRHALATTK